MCQPFLYFFAQPIVNTRGIVIANILRRTYGTFTCLVVRNKNYLLLPHFSLFPKGAKSHHCQHFGVTDYRVTPGTIDYTIIF